MAEKRLVFLALLILSLIFVSFVEAEEEKVKAAYDWLLSKTKSETQWANLEVGEHSFALIALSCNESLVKLGNKTLQEKSFVDPQYRQCWPRPQSNCKITETALAALALNKIGSNADMAVKWLLNRTLFFSDLNWYIELDIKRGLTADCAIFYEGGQAGLTIEANKTLTNLSQTGTACFRYEDGTNWGWWLKINSNCYEKTFKVKCVVSDPNENYRVTIKYKDPNDPTVWHLSTKSDLLKSGEVFEFSLDSYCLANPGSSSCDYEGTLWATYLLKEVGNEKWAKFVPYLIIAKAANEKYLPSALLYKIGLERYGDELIQNQQGFWKAENTAHGQFYDTAFAGLTGLGDLDKARSYLITNPNFKEDVYGKRYWKCAETGCKELRDTAFLLFVFWPELCPGIAPPAGNCEEQGYSCKAECGPDETEVSSLSPTCGTGLICCKPVGAPEERNCAAVGGSCKYQCSEDEFKPWPDSWGPAVGCSGVEDCCKNYSQAKSCGEVNGKSCGADEKCVGNEITIATGEVCCIGECKPVAAATCSDLGGVDCSEDEVCIDSDSWRIIGWANNTDKEDHPRCCVGKCVTEKTCEELNGEKCAPEEECEGTTEESKDVKNCCVGTCKKSCKAIGVYCSEKEKCVGGHLTESIEGPRCCVGGECKKPSRAWLFILLLVVAVAGFAFYLFKLRKPKPKKPTLPPLVGRPLPGMPPRPLPSAPAPAALPRAPQLGKTEKELEKTLKKLRGLTKKK